MGGRHRGRPPYEWFPGDNTTPPVQTDALITFDSDNLYVAFKAQDPDPKAIRANLMDRDICTLCEENKITGFQGIAPGRNLELTPTVTATRADTREGGRIEAGDEDFEPGLTARWGITPNATLSATANPDFSQVEADILQLAVNTRFALFFPEKRPFFLEGADLYITPLEAVFTRTVAEPDWGIKFNVKEGRNAFGAFVARDDINNLIIPSNQASRRAFFDQKVDEGVMRYRRDVGERSSIGVLYTGREADGYHNHVAGLDGLLRFTKSDTVRVQYLRSDTLYPELLSEQLGEDPGSFDGSGFQAQYDHFSKLWRAFVRYQDLDPGFRADSGFIPRVDVKTGEGQYERVFYGSKDKWYAQATLGVHGLRTDDHEGTLTDQVAEVFGTLTGRRQSTYDLRIQKNKEFFRGTTSTSTGSSSPSASTPPAGRASSSSPARATRSTSPRPAWAGRSSSTPPSSSGWAAV